MSQQVGGVMASGTADWSGLAGCSWRWCWWLVSPRCSRMSWSPRRHSVR
ncbi:hypothetical protein FHR84_002074 [Actinopolyspora biskrensis]|uniref:Uncharacterized protein n=1 Tax=Actinopolyspora biskrensis TaxID=1470178 RepID=A0A852YYZ7_9ACTN|nr:hypothetical protein [Actinopolyspora biskrensis]NYH78749.1 hypothetical protein [Actinopolyspora biskrensis]